MEANKDNLISIIVPIYNAELYLHQCIESVLKQDYPNFELILINDESTDSSGEICDYYERLDNRVIVIHKKNGGVSSARNCGLDRATGEYVTFLDADDFLTDNILGRVISYLTQPNKLLITNYNYIIHNKVQSSNSIYKNDITMNKFLGCIISGIKESEKFNFGEYLRAVWGKFFDLKIIKQNKIRFNSKLYIGEDAIFLLEYCKYLNCKDIEVINEYGYNYRITCSSAVRRYKSDLLEQCEQQLILIKNNIDLNDNHIKVAISNFCWEVLFSLSRNSIKGIDNKVLNKTELKIDVMYWLKKYRSELDNNEILSFNVRKFTRVLYIMNRIIPYKVLCMIIILKEKILSRS